MTTNSKVKRVLIMAGGTGGHVFPALAVANELRTRGIEVVWMGTHAGLEARLVPEAGYPIEWIPISGLRKKGILSWLSAPWYLIRAFLTARAAVRRVSPNVVLGMGGFASGPGGLAASLLGIPLVIHEQNSVLGLTNRLLTKRATQALEGFPDTFSSKMGAIYTGNPIRPEIASLATQPRAQATRSPEEGDKSCWHLLVLGGSQGATALNTLLPEALGKLRARSRPEVWHQCGARFSEQTQAAYREAGVIGKIEPFITDMAAAYHWADLVVCRSGALTVAEVSAAGVASILVPYPHAVDDHQTTNAHLLSNAGAAILLPQKEITSDGLAKILRGLCENPERLEKMGREAHAVARPTATEEVVAHLLSAAK
ncbi:N-acetylglucosaminyl transferase [Gammaproteobacteria bacterium]